MRKAPQELHEFLEAYDPGIAKLFLATSTIRPTTGTQRRPKRTS